VCRVTRLVVFSDIKVQNESAWWWPLHVHRFRFPGAVTRWRRRSSSGWFVNFVTTANRRPNSIKRTSHSCGLTCPQYWDAACLSNWQQWAKCFAARVARVRCRATSSGLLFRSVSRTVFRTNVRFLVHTRTRARPGTVRPPLSRARFTEFRGRVSASAVCSCDFQSTSRRLVRLRFLKHAIRRLDTSENAGVILIIDARRVGGGRQ